MEMSRRANHTHEQGEALIVTVRFSHRLEEEGRVTCLSMATSASSTTALPAASTSAASAAACYARHGLFYMHNVLSAEDLATLQEAAAINFGEILRTLVLKEVLASRAGEASPPVRYAEVVERDGGRYDSRHGFGSGPLSRLLRGPESSATLVEALRGVLGDDAEVVALGQIVALSPEWELLDPEDDEDQAWHTDGRGSTETDALTLFIPLVDTTEENGATQFVLGSQNKVGEYAAAAPDALEAEAVTLCLPAGSAVAFDYRTLHRGLRNRTPTDRPVLYAIVGRPVYRSDGAKGLPSLDVGSSSSLFSGEPVTAASGFPLLPAAAANGDGRAGGEGDEGGVGDRVGEGVATRTRRSMKRLRETGGGGAATDSK
jgi:hypothetical protein